MKRIIVLFVVALPLMVGAQAPATVISHVDTVNYMLGLMNGDGIRHYVVGADTADAKRYELFCNGFDQTVGLSEGSRYMDLAGYCRGASLARESRDGFLFNDSTVPARRDLIINAFKECIMGKAFGMSKDDAMAFIQRVVGSKRQQGVPANPTAAQVDTLNRCIGFLNADESLTNVLKGSNARTVKMFAASFERGFNMDMKDEPLFNGMDQGLRFTAWLNQDSFVFSERSLPVEWQMVKAGIDDGLRQSAKRIATPEQAAAYMANLNTQLEMQKNAPLIEKNTRFLEENAKRPGVKTTPSGLQYEVVTEGKGAKPQPTDKVKVHYTGKLIDGTVFDSSVQRGEPLEFPLNRVIQGWQEGLGLMNVGSKYVLYIPYTLGYGERGAGNMIPPYSTLIFEVELLDIVKE